MTSEKLIEEIYNPGESLSDNQVIFSNRVETWNFHIFGGKLLYVADASHNVRRWNRAIQQHCPKWNWWSEFPRLVNDNLWECQLLDRGVQRKQISLIQAKLVIRTIIQECLFELSDRTSFQEDWKTSSIIVSSLSGHIALSLFETQSIFARALTMQKKWQAAGFSDLNPAFSPILCEKINHRAFSGLDLPISDRYFNPNFTLWDIALLLNESVTNVACSLMPLVKKGIVQFQPVPDLPMSAALRPMPLAHQPARKPAPLPAALPQTNLVHPPTRKPAPPPVTLPQTNENQPLIACIDDSAVLAYTLKKILVPAGYKVITIPEPMRGFSQLIEHQPDLILLDLLLPNADGYSVCKFLRDTPRFKETPIIILTAKSGFIDRTRAQLVGATEFLSKPPQAEELLRVVQKYIYRVYPS
jgi:two-component system, chemotaxis family, response regulator PixG